MAKVYDRKEYHVVSHPDGWAVKRAGAERASSVLPRKDEAIEKGAVLAESAGGKLVIHRKDGKVQRERIYGKAPRVTGGLRSLKSGKWGPG